MSRSAIANALANSAVSLIVSLTVLAIIWRVCGFSEQLPGVVMWLVTEVVSFAHAARVYNRIMACRCEVCAATGENE